MGVVCDAAGVLHELCFTPPKYAVLKGVALIDIPLVKPFREMNATELRAYFDWFIAGIPARIEELKCAVRETGANDVVLDGTRESLIGLGGWMTRNVRASRVPLELIDPPPPREDLISDKFTYRFDLISFSYCFDIGVYFGDMFVTHYPQLRWDQEIVKKRFVHFGEPIISGFGLKRLNPIGVVVTLAFGMFGGRKDQYSLLKAYDSWKEFVV